MQAIKQAGLVGYYLYGGGGSEDEAYSLCSCSVLLRERLTWVQAIEVVEYEPLLHEIRKTIVHLASSFFFSLLL